MRQDQEQPGPVRDEAVGLAGRSSDVGPATAGGAGRPPHWSAEHAPRHHEPTGPPHHPEPIDPDVDLHVPSQRPVDAALLVAVSAGGVLGALARYGLGEWFPHHAGQWPAATFAVNVSGCLLIGVLMVALQELLAPHRLARPFLGVGVLGGYTTFSTAGLDVQQLILAGRPLTAWLYLLGTAAVALAAAWLGTTATRAAGRRLGRA